MISSNVFIGVAGWNHAGWRDLLGAPSASHIPEITLLSQLFDLLEDTASYNYPVDAKTSQQWLAQTQDRAQVRFLVRVWQKLVRERSPSYRADVELVKRGVQPLLHARRLGALVLPFPASFRMNEANEEWVWRLLDGFAGFPLILELWHSSWQQSALLPRLPALGVVVASTGEPGRAQPLAPRAVETVPLAYLRLNGHPAALEQKPEASGAARHDRLYRAADLTQLAETVRSLGHRAAACYVVFHNSSQGQALVNAVQLRSAVLGRKISLPENLRRNFPELEAVAAGPPPDQLEMF